MQAVIRARGAAALRSFLCSVALCGMALTALPAFSAELAPARDFKADAQAACASGRPLLVFFASHGCPYCRVVEEDYLVPMLRQPQGERPIIRVVMIDDLGTLRDFTGKRVPIAEFARLQGASLTPHVKLLGPDGKELAPALIGLMTQDFYGGYLEAAIASATEKMRAALASKTCPHPALARTDISAK